MVTDTLESRDAFDTEIRYTIARTGETVARTGKALIYTGYQWRGRANDWREVLFVERSDGMRQAVGRLGVDTLTPALDLGIQLRQRNSLIGIGLHLGVTPLRFGNAFIFVG